MVKNGTVKKTENGTVRYGPGSGDKFGRTIVLKNSSGHFYGNPILLVFIDFILKLIRKRFISHTNFYQYRLLKNLIKVVGPNFTYFPYRKNYFFL